MGIAFARACSVFNKQEFNSVTFAREKHSRIAGIPAPGLGGQLYTLYGFRAPLVVHLAYIVVYGVLVFSLREGSRACVYRAREGAH
jgi:hypothetical protein